ncbi:Y-family DNA polymerase [Bacteroides neonati]|uniref:Y-family DNA polymerase n=1 Tax=Bacteroides neonati TaxID=1347393 RepID=UPI0004B80285|nr:Y-family DNA polymerase [Bacteroides neonati]
MYGLVDCNNFFVSCERVFNPALRSFPVVVLSNNDGCVISRSEEAKKLGIPMGQPAFKIKPLLDSNQLVAFSSNYSLYGDMSHRVMSTLSTFVEDIEVYSIDEAFLNFNGFEKYDLHEYGQMIVRTTTKGTGIPVSMGIAPTKTLAKVASKFAKKYPRYKGACIIDSDEKREKALKLFDVGDVWGIGRRLVKMLNYHGVNTAYDLTQKSESWVRSKMTVIGVRTWKELRGIPCIEMETVSQKQTICTSRSFGEMISSFDTLMEAVANFTSACAKKLREQKCCAKVIMVFIYTNRHREDLMQYSQNKVITLPFATNDTVELIAYARMALTSIYREGYQFKKAGVIVSDIANEQTIIRDLFDPRDTDKQKRLLSVVDEINRKSGSNCIQLAIQAGNHNWKLKREFISHNYTTNLDDLIQISCE